MTLSEEMARFKAQYTAAEWDRLFKLDVFCVAWKANNLVGAGEIANRWLYGDLDYRQHRIAKWIRNWEF